MNNKVFKRTVWALFIVYCAVLAFVLLSPTLHHPQAARSCSLVPFATVAKMLGGTVSADTAVRNIAVNILILVPFGAALPVLFPKLRRFWKVTALAAAVVLLFEIAQYAFNLGTFDIDDIILNTLGAALGYALVSIPPLKKALLGREEADNN